MHHAVYRVADGALVSVGRGAPPSSLPEDLAAATFDGDFDMGANDWNAEAKAWVPKPPVAKIRFTRLEFRSRLTLQEQVALDLASQGVTEQAATLRVILGAWAAADYISTEDPRTAEGVGVLVQFGILTPERAAAVLAPELVTP